MNLHIQNLWKIIIATTCMPVGQYTIYLGGEMDKSTHE